MKIRQTSDKKAKGKMTASSKRSGTSKLKKSSENVKSRASKAASSGIKHQVILPRSSCVSKSSTGASQRIHETTKVVVANPIGATQLSSPLTSIQSTKNVKSSARVSKRNGVWYLGGNHVVKLLTSVDGDLDHSILSKLAAVPTVVGELALSVESLVSDDITVGGFENDILAKIASNTLTAKRGVIRATNTGTVTPTPQAYSSPGSQSKGLQPKTKSSDSTSTVPNPLLANYQPVPNPLAIRITPPASPHTTVKEQPPTVSPKTRNDTPLVQAR